MAIPIPTIDDFNDTTVMRTIRKVVAYLKDPIVDTINELEETVSGYDDVIGEVERYNNRISTLETEMDAVETKNTEQDTAISENATAIQSEATARKNNDITALNITYNSGNLQAIMSRLAGSIEGSVDLPFIQTAELIPTSTERAFMIRFTFWDGTQYDTNDFVIPEGSGSGTDVTVSAITVNDGTADNSFQVAIQLSDGSSISSNDYVISSSGEGGTTVTAVSGSVSGNTLTLNIANSDSTSVNGTVEGLVSSVSNVVTGNFLITTVNGVASTAVTLPSGGGIPSYISTHWTIADLIDNLEEGDYVSIVIRTSEDNAISFGGFYSKSFASLPTLIGSGFYNQGDSYGAVYSINIYNEILIINFETESVSSSINISGNPTVFESSIIRIS